MINMILGYFLMCFMATQYVMAEQPQHEQAIDLKANQSPSIERIGAHKFQIGKILLDKKAREFSVPAKFLQIHPPLEFLAVAKGGSRGYESLFELDASVYEFNLACILIGLDTHKGKPPGFHFDPTPVTGEAVEILISWQQNEQTITHKAADFFSYQDKHLDNTEWVYTGSTFLPNGGGYLADLDGGTLIGFVHDPASIIEHKTGFSGESYSRLKINNALIPPLETQVTLHIQYSGLLK